MFSTQGKPIKCKAAIAWSMSKPLSIETIEVAPPEKDEVRVKIIATGVCHSDASFLNGFDPKQRFPVLLGHEAAGIVESVGKEVKSFQPGDHVIPLFLPQCLKCEYCKNPDTNLCAKLVNEEGDITDGPKSIKCNEVLISQLANVGTFSEYSIFREINLTKINPKAPLEKIPLFGCCVPTGYGSAVHCAKIKKGSTCAIWGLGGVGMSVVMGCLHQEAKEIIGVDINPKKFQLAKKFGCTKCINPKDFDKPIEHVLMEMTNGGVDYSLVAVGNNNVVKSALMATRMGTGKLIVIGLIPDEISFNAMALLMGRTVIGTYCGDSKGLTDIPKMVDEYLEGKLPTDDLITHKISLDDINKGFDLMKSGESLRTVVIIDHEK